jgi:hypothetical protein
MGKDTLDRYFGLSIAYLIPGLIALYGISYQVPELRTWFGVVAESETTLAGFLFAMVASVGVGVMLSAVRSFLLEDVTGWARPRTGVDWSKRKEVESAYQALLNDHYTYYKCYGNTAVAIVVFAACYFWSFRNELTVWQWIGAVVGTTLFVALLVYKAVDCVCRFEDKRGDLLGWPKQA